MAYNPPGHPWRRCTRTFTDSLQPERESKVAIIVAAPPEGSLSDAPNLFFRDFPTLEDLKSHAETTLQLASQPDSAVKNSMQVIFLPSIPEAVQTFKEIFDIVNPTQDGRAFELDGGTCTFFKDRWRTKADADAVGQDEETAAWEGPAHGWTALNCTYYMQDPGLLDRGFSAFFPANNTTIIVYCNTPTVWGPLKFLTNVRENFLPLRTPGIFSHPLAAMLMTAHWLLMYYTIASTPIDSIRKVMRETGFHLFTNVDRADARKLTPNQLAEYTSDMMASNSTLHNDIGSVRGLMACLDLVCEENKLVEEWVKHRKAKGQIIAHDEIDAWSRHLKTRAESVLGHKEGWSMRANAVVQGLQNVIGQKNQEETRKIAEESRRLAEQSRRLAEASWKDTASVTAVTLITMLFLPATFMATLFSADFIKDLFNNNATRQATTYAAVTVPLTAVVVVVWYIWTAYRRRRAKIMLQRRQTLESQRETVEISSEK